ncbi:unnamed protein product [Notodromas monacha]|uniref:Dolichyl-diphosphooligosaccharide--protein glycosyltransferase subunit 2 n=1 Tax=Notodromas monacha TaxID=399045 RepID=A0A7R9BER2_9CRUS|nr:unnamed protein product [Notodromas monacha]CAG0913143.1 unnamed protein product [Notodromas monacha]
MLSCRFFPLFLLLAFIVITTGISPSSYLSGEDKARLKKVFDHAWAQKDLSNVHYSLAGYNLLGITDVPDAPNTCKFLQSNLEAVTEVEAIFHAFSAAAGLKSCPLKLSANQKQLLSNTLQSEETSVHNIFQAFEASKLSGTPVDEAKLIKSLTSALKKDDNLLNLGLSFHVAAKLESDPKQFFERIEDAIVQADEVDGKFLQFEGGLSITGMIISGAYNLAAKMKTPPAITPDQAVKFANYFLSRKSVQTAKGAFYLLDAMKVLTVNNFHVPVSVTLASSLSIRDDTPWLRIRVTNLLGEALGPMKVVAESTKRLQDNAVVMSQTPFATVQGDQTLYELNMMKTSMTRGFYQLSVKVDPEKDGEKFVGNSGAIITVKVMSEMTLDPLELWVTDADGSVASNVLKATYPNKVGSVLEADDHQKVMAKFVVKDKRGGAPLVAHQAFVRLNRVGTSEEVIFVAEPDSSSKSYKFDLDVGAKEKTFGRQSGLYTMHLIIGDATISNPIEWELGNVNLEFRSGSGDQVKKSKFDEYKSKPEIKHMFREPEKRPSDVVANAFSLLVLVPLVLLLALWMKLGVNLSNFPLSLGAVGFHIGLGCIFGLYYVFWVQLDMFTTIKYLFGLAIVTFLCGNSVLAKVADERKKAGAAVDPVASKPGKVGH